MAGRLLSRNRNPLFYDHEGPYVDVLGPLDAPMPEGEFALILCVTQPQVTRLLSAAAVGAAILYGSDQETLAPLYTALNTQDAPLCGPEGGDCDDDVWDDVVLALADGVLENVLSGGQMTALGYEIEEEGELEAETELPLIAIAFVAIGAAFVLSLALGLVTIGSVAVAAGETVELLILTGASAGNPVSLTALALAA